MTDYIDFSKGEIVVNIGKPRSGKSNATAYFVKKAASEGIFKYGIVFTKTKYANQDYDYIPNKYVFSEYKPEILQQFIKYIENKKNKKQPCFVIFDDQQGLLNRNDPTLLNFISIHRHLGPCSIFFNFQYLYGSMPTLRECTTISLMFNSKGKRTLDGLFENFGQLFDNFDDFKKYFLSLTSEKYVAMMYIQDIDDIDKNYLYFKAPAMDKYKNVKLKY